MNILFLTLADIRTINMPGIYTDLLREFAKNGHHMYVVSPFERRLKQQTHVIREDNSTILKIKIGNTQKTNIIEKGISTILIEPITMNGVKKYFADIHFDLVIYSTPPISFVSAIEYVKNRDNARTYLLLKDIFPQNAVDLGMLSKKGLKGLLYRYFRNLEKRLYRVSDRIGCMSEANVKFVLENNPEIDASRVEVCPNSIEAKDKSVDAEVRRIIRNKYGIPNDKKVFVYGGNLGKPQGIRFLIECMNKCKEIHDSFFLVVGNGTEYGLLENYARSSTQKNFMLMKRIPQEDYNTLIAACDVGLIFLDHRFTIPNFPSRLLGYMQAKLPVLACTDVNSDVGKVITEGCFGWWCESNDAEGFSRLIHQILSGTSWPDTDNEYRILLDRYSSKMSYQIIMNSIRTIIE